MMREPSWRFKPSESTSVRASLGSGFRAATVFEKYIEADHSGFTIIPNPDLRPESAWSWDIGIRQSFGEYHHVECSFFQSDYEDMIEPVINFLGTIQYQNFVRARIRGVECFAESWHWRRRLGLRGSLTWMDPENLKTGETLPYRPRFSGNVEAILKLGDFRLSAEYQYASRIENVEIRPLDPRVPTKLAHIRAEYAWREFRVQVAVTNLLNYHYTQVEQRMAEVRKYTLSLLFDTGK